MHRKEKETERLRKLKGGHTTTLAKRYKLPLRAAEIIERAGRIHEKIQNWFMETYFL
jgi:hypothetical protein